MRMRFVYGVSGDWTTRVAGHPWTPQDDTIGGRRVSASGVPASYIVRRERLLEVTLRVYEQEWDELLALVAFGQTQAPFDWYPDVDGDAATSVEVYLQEPAPGTSWAPTRSAEYPHILEQTLLLRAAAEADIWREYFSDDHPFSGGPIAPPSGGGGTGVAPSRTGELYTTASLAPGATEQGAIALDSPGSLLLQLSASGAARVRFYATAADRGADLARPEGTDPDAGRGVLGEFIFTAADQFNVAPPVLLYNADSPVVSTIYLAIRNKAGVSAAITITLVYLPLEAAT